MQLREPIPECDEFSELLKSVRLHASSDRVDSQLFLPQLSKARSSANHCYEACVRSLREGRQVVERVTDRSLNWIDVKECHRRWHKELDGYERIVQNLPFSHWAGGTLDDHENKPTATQALNDELNFLNDRHTQRDHVRINAPTLRENVDSKEGWIASSFFTEEIAEWAIARTLAFYWDDVLAWLRLSEAEATSRWEYLRLDLPDHQSYFATGRDVGQSFLEPESKLYIVTCVRVVLVRDAAAPRGFWIKNAFPGPA